MNWIFGCYKSYETARKSTEQIIMEGCIDGSGINSKVLFIKQRQNYNCDKILKKMDHYRRN